MLSAQEIRSLSQAQLDWAVETRRALHRVPEKGFQEEKTKALIVQKLAQSGIEYEVAPGGWILGWVPGAQSGKVTAVRADFDALPVTEPEGCPFGSTHPGWMHACGHDMHTAILLSAGRALKDASKQLRGGFLMLFEPAEETEGGAKPMAESGLMEKWGVDRVYGLHVMPRLVVGQVETRPGTLNASTDGVHITVKGTGSHGAYPENGCDAIVCAAQIVTALQSIVARNVSPLESAVLTLGTVQGGRAANIICDEVKLTGTLRCADKPLHDKLVRRIQEVCSGVAAAMGCAAQVEILEGYSALVNDKAHAQRVLDMAKRLVGEENTLIKDAPSMGGEDFSYFLDHAPGAFFHVGCSPDAQHIGAPLHSAQFKPDERAIPIGISMEMALALWD